MELGINKAQIYAYTHWAPLFYVLGLVGSIASLITLQSSKFSARIYVYLKSLALADLGFLVFAISNMSTRVLEESKSGPTRYDQSEYSIAIYHLCELPIINGFLSLSVFIVVCMTMDRYFAICQPTEYQRSKTTLNPRIEVLLSFFLAFTIQLPHFFASDVVNAHCKIPRFHFNSTTDLDPIIWEHYPLFPLDGSFDPVATENVTDLIDNTPILLNCYCLTESGFHALQELNISVIKGSTICPHLYETLPLPGLSDSFLWITYKIFCEILVRLGPTVLLIAMNVAIIHHFNVSMHRKKKLRASKFVQRTSSQLFPSELFPKRNSSFFEATAATKTSTKYRT